MVLLHCTTGWAPLRRFKTLFNYLFFYLLFCQQENLFSLSPASVTSPHGTAAMAHTTLQPTPKMACTWENGQHPKTALEKGAWLHRNPWPTQVGQPLALVFKCPFVNASPPTSLPPSENACPNTAHQQTNHPQIAHLPKARQTIKFLVAGKTKAIKAMQFIDVHGICSVTAINKSYPGSLYIFDWITFW